MPDPPAAAPRLLYTIPTFHNPAGVSLSAARRQRLLELARRHDIILVEDDVYRELVYDGEAPPSAARAGCGRSGRPARVVLQVARARAPSGLDGRSARAARAAGRRRRPRERRVREPVLGARGRRAPRGRRLRRPRGRPARRVRLTPRRPRGGAPGSTCRPAAASPCRPAASFSGSRSRRGSAPPTCCPWPKRAASPSRRERASAATETTAACASPSACTTRRASRKARGASARRSRRQRLPAPLPTPARSRLPVRRTISSDRGLRTDRTCRGDAGRRSGGGDRAAGARPGSRMATEGQTLPASGRGLAGATGNSAAPMLAVVLADGLVPGQPLADRRPKPPARPFARRPQSSEDASRRVVHPRVCRAPEVSASAWAATRSRFPVTSW